MVAFTSISVSIPNLSTLKASVICSMASSNEMFLSFFLQSNNSSFPYKIVYEIQQDETIVVYAVYHDKQNSEKLTERE